MTAVLLNGALVFVGALIGAFFKARVIRFKDTCFAAVALAIMAMAIFMTYNGMTEMTKSAMGDFALLILSATLVVGGVVGEIFALDDRVGSFGHWLESKIAHLIPNSIKDDGQSAKGSQDKPNQSSFVQGFTVSTVLFCAGALSILGPLQAGIGDNSTLLMKSVLDGASALILGATLGLGVAFSSVSIIVFEGLIALFAVFINPYLTDLMIASISALGGVLILALAGNVLGYLKVKVINLLPGIVIIAVVSAFF